MAAANPAKFNLRNPAVKRIMQEIKEMQAETCTDFIAEALEDDIFEWHFVVRGPPDTEFEGGIYHGRILLPSEYPFKPPSFMMLTANGRFQTGVKVCLSISSHHPEHWQPSWSVRTALTALIAFMPTPGQGALGSLDFTKDERQQLAVKSRAEVPKFGSAARQKVVSEMHQRMLQLQQQQQQQVESSSSKAGGAAAAADSPAGPDAPPPAAAAAAAARAAAARAAAAGSDQDSSENQQQHHIQAMQGAPVAVQHPWQREQDAVSSSMQDNNRGSTGNAAAAKKTPTAPSASAAATPAVPVVPAPAAAAAPAVGAAIGHPVYVAARAGSPVSAAAGGGGAVGSRPGELPGDRGLTFLAVVLSVAIAAMLLKKVMTAMSGYRLLV